MKHKMPAYKTLEQIFKKLHDLEQIEQILSWDNAIIMPVKSANIRAEQLSTLKSLQHAILTDEGVTDLLFKAESEKNKLSGWQSVNLEYMLHIYKHADATPRKLLKELSKAKTECEIIWRTARKENNFKMVVNPFKEVVNLTRQIAQAKGERLKLEPYDALLDQYDHNRKSEQLDVIFGDLKKFLPDFTAQVVEKQKSIKYEKLAGPFDITKQKELTDKLLAVLQFDKETGRIDESCHPFCGGYKNDIRIATRYDVNDFTKSLMAVIHEVGHANYESHLPDNWSSQPVGRAQGMSIHESQSLLMEMQVGRSKEFISFICSTVKTTLGKRGKAWSEENLYNHLTKVEPSLIRVDADEVTYTSHIILRYYIEKYLIAGEMEVEDLPDAWAQGMEKFVGITPDSDANGCMQDIHWFDGSFGYFPTYSLGAIYAAQFFAAAKSSNEKILPSIAEGNLGELNKWLNDNIHDKASRYKPDELVKNVTGKELDVEIFKNYLTNKYLAD